MLYPEHCLASLTCLPSTMHYSNLRNEAEVPEPRVDPGSSAAKLALGPGDELFKKRESYWFLALVVVLVLIGSIVFYCAHTGGQDTQHIYLFTPTCAPVSVPAGSGYPVSAGYSYTDRECSPSRHTRYCAALN